MWSSQSAPFRASAGALSEGLSKFVETKATADLD